MKYAKKNLFFFGGKTIQPAYSNSFFQFKLKLLDESITALSHKGMRIVALATSSNPLPETSPASLPKGLTLVGILAINDELRPESKEALRMAKQAGIQTVMITGDRCALIFVYLTASIDC